MSSRNRRGRRGAGDTDSGRSIPESGAATRRDALPDCPLAESLAIHLRGAREALVTRWLERIESRVRIDRGRIFPSEELLDHVPVLIDAMADYLEDPADEITADAPLVAKAMELGEMRHEQAFDAHEILKEYEILGGILFTFLIGVIDEIDEPCTLSEVLACAHRLFRSITVIQQVTMSTYLTKAHERTDEREQRLRGFHRALSHELKNRVGVLQNAASMLNEDFLLEDDVERHRFQSMVAENANAMRRVIENLTELSRVESDARQRRHVALPETVFEVARQLREYARARDVRIEIADDLPDMEVPSSALELILTNYVSNSIRYHDPKKTDRWVRISGSLMDARADGECELVLEVQDNGRGVPPEHRDRLFERFFRGDEGDEIDGTGLGLSIVKQTADALGGRVWGEFGDGGTTFYLALPCRRAADRQA